MPHEIRHDSLIAVIGGRLCHLEVETYESGRLSDVKGQSERTGQFFGSTVRIQTSARCCTAGSSTGRSRR